MSAIFDNSHELMLCRYRNGIKLVRPDDLQSGSSPFVKSIGLKVKDILSQSFCTYFTDAETRNLHINGPTIIACGFDCTDANNKTLYTVMDKQSVDQIVRDNKKVINYKKQAISEHVSMRRDGVTVPTLDITTPWYNDSDDVIGVFGCAIVMGQQPLAETLSKIVNMGIISNDHSFTNSYGKELENLYFSKRELECIELTLLGKPAKEAAYILGLSQRTVEEYIGNIKLKLGVLSKSAMIEKLHSIFKKV